MSPTAEAGLVLVATGTAAVVVAGIAALGARTAYHRLHLATVVTSLGGPLVAAGLCLQHGAGLTRASIILPVALLLAAGPVVSSAVGRMLAQQEGRRPPRSPD